MISFCSLDQAPSSEPKFTSLAWFSYHLAYLSMLFIPEMFHTVGNARGAGEVKLGLYDGAWSAEYNDVTFRAISQNIAGMRSIFRPPR